MNVYLHRQEIEGMKRFVNVFVLVERRNSPASNPKPLRVKKRMRKKTERNWRTS